MLEVDLELNVKKAYIGKKGDINIPHKDGINVMVMRHDTAKFLMSMWLKNRINHSAMRRGKEPYYFDRQGKPY